MKERQGHQSATSKAKDSKKLDLFGRKVYSTEGDTPQDCKPASAAGQI